MPEQDEPQQKAFQAAKAIGDMAGKLWLQANADGVRTGLDVAATLIGQIAAGIPADDLLYSPTEVVTLLYGARDQIHLLALQLPDPDDKPIDV